MSDVCLLVPQTHRPYKPFKLGRSSGCRQKFVSIIIDSISPSRLGHTEIWPNKCRLGNDPLPRLLGRLLARLDNLEHLLLCNTPDLGQWHGELGGLLGPLILDLRAQRLGIGRIRSVKQIAGDRVGGLLLGSGALDVALLVSLDRLAQLDLLVVPFLGIEFGPQAAEVLCILGRLVTFTGGLFTCAFFVVETPTMLFDGAFDVLVLRLSEGRRLA